MVVRLRHDCFLDCVVVVDFLIIFLFLTDTANSVEAVYFPVVTNESDVHDDYIH